ncbi:MAG: hypothetical protein RLZZ385_2690 [Pseudomonadota bacterium]|jgi:tetratricopeptide (TPR) repeat protein
MSDASPDKTTPPDGESRPPAAYVPERMTGGSTPSPKVWLALGFLVIIALAVVFVLPGVVERYELPLEPRVDTADLVPAPASMQPAVNAVSPFNEAQRALQRKDAQDALALLLERQAELDAASVQSWGAADYQQALALAQQGDDAYLQQDFLAARESYGAGADLLAEVQSRMPGVLEQYLAEGERALQDDAAALAQEKFSLALTLDPLSETATLGLQRARTLDQVNELLDQAELAEAAGELESARGLYQQARNLDSRHPAIDGLLRTVDDRILENRFAQIMSSGYAHLQNNDPQQAIAAFQRAAALGINAEQALAAITQTEDEVARVEIEQMRGDAARAESAEDWAAAVAAYEAALAIDPNLVFAIDGRDYAAKRLHLDRLLEGANANPERLADAAVYQETLDVYYTGRSLDNPGQRLTAQLQHLQGLLESSQVPETVQLVSDNLTDVTLLRVGSLGVFQSHALELKPGRYVAVGTRAGYRDVRQEFVVGFGQTPASIIIKCEEQVVANRSR